MTASLGRDRAQPSNSMDASKAAQRERIRALTPEQRILLALELGRTMRALQRAIHGR